VVPIAKGGITLDFYSPRVSASFPCECFAVIHKIYM
jgi:hypothetical protein